MKSCFVAAAAGHTVVVSSRRLRAGVADRANGPPQKRTRRAGSFSHEQLERGQFQAAGRSISSRLVPVLGSRTSRVSSTTANVCTGGLPPLHFIATRVCRRNRFCHPRRKRIIANHFETFRSGENRNVRVQQRRFARRRLSIGYESPRYISPRRNWFSSRLPVTGHDRVSQLRANFRWRGEISLTPASTRDRPRIEIGDSIFFSSPREDGRRHGCPATRSDRRKDEDIERKGKRGKGMPRARAKPT